MSVSRRVSCTLGSVQLTLLQSFSHHSKDIVPYKALSKRVKSWKNLRKKHDVMLKAVAAYAKEQLKPAVERLGARCNTVQNF